jgi:CheY-like chemotaxis protein
MDLQMPEMNGLEVSRLIRAAASGTGEHIPIVALTANAMAGDGEICLEAGMDDYLPKPIEAQQLRAILQRQARLRKNFITTPAS